MSASPTFPQRYRDEEVDSSDVESQASSVPPGPVAASAPRWQDHGSNSKSIFARIWRLVSNPRGPVRRGSSSARSGRKRRRTRWCRYWLVIVSILIFLGAIVALVYFSLVGTLIQRLNPPAGTSGLHRIVDKWQEPDENGAYEFEWREDFSRNIVPKNCHSHNDYWRAVPLYEALAAGCVGVEADVWLTDDRELLVSHTWKSTRRDRTLRSLYLDPLARVFAHREVSPASVGEKEVGLFDFDPDASVVLLIDFKNEGREIWPVLLEQLQPLREKNWLTYFNGSDVVRGPLTIVGTGNTPFELVLANSTNRFVFFDAPLGDISNPVYSAENSYYASIQMKKAIGRVSFNELKDYQIEVLRAQINAADAKGLKSRYWDTPAWPISLRDKVWIKLEELGTGMLNVDDLVSATRWNWNWCIVAGLNLCGNS